MTLLQFTRIALVFTAISNGWAAMLLQSRATGEGITPAYAMAQTLVSIGLYAFGMALNDVIDRRRDSQVAAHRPLPSGRLTVPAAHFVCALLALIALAGGAWMAIEHPGQWISLGVLLGTLALIIFYDFAGKYLVAMGLLSLGLIRFFHASIAAPTLAIPWHAILLLLHVTILSTVCYGLEDKRPRLTRRHWASVSSGLVLVIGILLTLLITRRGGDFSQWQAALSVKPGLIFPAIAAAGFVVLAALIIRRTPDSRTAGRTLML
ncbi:MAG TPA: UbiA family prenyltransferase, partial [Tepidisphaeraceae bacterium]